MSLTRCRVVLVKPHYAGNLGATARVMRNFGLSDLVLVAPYCFPTDLEARRMARGGLEILDAARTVPDLGAALADCVYTFGTSSLTAGVIRGGTIGTAAEKMPELLAATDAGPVAVVFGPEPHGLSNDEIARCHGLVHIPVDAEYGSLNLAQAVAICCYELRKAWSNAENEARNKPPAPADAHAAPGERALAGLRGPSVGAHAAPGERALAGLRGRSIAPFADQERMYAHLYDALAAVGFLFGEKGDSLMHGIRHLIGRAQPTPQEVKILHGLARQLLWAAGQINERSNRDTPPSPS